MPIRAFMILLAFGGAATAAPDMAHRQPRPDTALSEPGKGEAPKMADPTKLDPAVIEKARVEQADRDRRWDAKTKKAMSGVCRGC